MASAPSLLSLPFGLLLCSRLGYLLSLQVSSDDEFMSMDWTNLWYDSFQKSFGETHLLIVQDSEHSLATGIPEVVESLSAAMESIGAFP